MGNFALAGNLSFLNLGDILQFLGSNTSTGVLYITSRYTQTQGKIYFVKGNPVNASAPKGSCGRVQQQGLDLHLGTPSIDCLL